jgi:histidine ammonia-lyase
VYIQKAYTLRAIPQVVGAVRDTLYHARDVVQVELNSSNDNPLFLEAREIFHGANFHGRPVAFVMDFATIALTQLGVFSERGTNRLLDRHLSGLPEFLVRSLLPTLERDRYMSDDVEMVAAAPSRGELLDAPSAATSTCVDRWSDISSTGTRGGAGT